MIQIKNIAVLEHLHLARRTNSMDSILLTQFDMPIEDSDLIIKFTNKVKNWAPASLKSIVLYGSVTKGFFPQEYDIDIVLLFSDNFDHNKYYREVYDMIKELKPHRSMHVVLKWVGELELEYQDLIEQEGYELYQKWQ
jgi:predicted nucleotidyltransferase